MGMGLEGETGKDYYFNHNSWHNVLILAVSSGWKPMGTITPERWCNPDWGYTGDVEKPWGGGYFYNDGQFVSREDAEALADALESALDDIPDHTELMPKEIMLKPGDTSEAAGAQGAVEQFIMNSGLAIRTSNPEFHPFEFLGGERKKYLTEFITFCRDGGFYIF